MSEVKPDPISSIIHFVEIGDKEAALVSLHRLRDELNQEPYYQRKVAELRMAAYQELSDALVEFRMFSVRANVLKKQLDVNAVVDALLCLYSASERYYPLFSFQLREAVIKIYEEFVDGIHNKGGDISQAEKEAGKVRDKIVHEAGVRPSLE